MDLTSILLLAVLFLVASVVSVISGSTSLITVPLMLEFGVQPHTAIATNMLALTFMSLGGTLPFIGKNVIDTKRLPLLIILTLVGSGLGALLLLLISAKSLPIIISLAMFAVAGFSIFYRREEGNSNTKPSKRAEMIGYIITFLLGIYGGFFSGGYVTLLTAAYVMLFQMTWLEAIATTKLINIFSSLIASSIFIQQGIIDYYLGIILSVAMFIGGIIGGYLSLKLSQIWLKRIYLMVVAILAVNTWRKSY